MFINWIFIGALNKLNHLIIISVFCLGLETIPATAKAIKIKNVKNPYCMRAYEVEKHTETLCMIEEKLLNFMKTNEFLKKKSNTKDTKIGDVSFIVLQLNVDSLINNLYKYKISHNKMWLIFIFISQMILVQDSFKAEKKLPSCICRGLITCIKKECGISYIILLVDHGISIELTRDKFHVLPKNLIPDEYLTKTVGVYDIIPICMRKSTILNGCNTIAM